MSVSQEPTSRTAWLSTRLMFSLVAAFCAGTAALMVQIACTRWAIQLYGTSAATIGVMIASSLLGLSGGAYLLGARADRCSNVQSLASWILIVVGIGAAALSWIGPSFDESIAWATSVLPFDQVQIQRLCFALVSMVPINVALGGIVPILVRDAGDVLNRRQASLGTLFGLLYAAETLGAAGGAILSGFWSIQNWGLRCTVLVASFICLAVGLFGCVVNRWRRPPYQPQVLHLSKACRAGPQSKFGRGVFLFVVALVGSTSLGMEVIWQRFFVILFGSDTHSYSAVAACYLLGISFGAAISPRVLRLLPNGVGSYALILAGIALATTGSAVYLLSIMTGDAANAVDFFDSQWPILSRFAWSAALLAFPTILIGIGFPAAVDLWVTDRSRLGRQTGQIYAVALVGNVAGVLGCGMILIPLFGLRTSLVVLNSFCALGGVGLCVAAFWSVKPSDLGHAKWMSLAVLMLVAAWCFLSYGLLNHAKPIGIAAESGQSLDYYREGPVNTVAVVRSGENSAYRKMVIDGITIGESLGGVDEKQQMLAHLPFLLRPMGQLRNVLTIGLGTGILAGELAENPFVDRVTCVELSPSVIEAAATFADINGDIFSHPAVQIVQTDGLRFLRSDPKKFDVIISDAKSRPGHAGNVAFFSEDFYRRCDRRLTDQGVFVQWVSLDTAPGALAVILNSFASSFPNGHVAISGPDSIYVIGSKRPISLTQEHFDDYYSKAHADSLRRYDWNTHDDFRSMYWLDHNLINELWSSSQLTNTLDKPTLEKFALASTVTQSRDRKRDNIALLEELIASDQNNGPASSLLNSSELRNLGNLNQQKWMAARRGAVQILKASKTLAELDKDWLDRTAEFYKTALTDLPNLTRQNQIGDVYRQLALKAQTQRNVNREFSALLNIDELECSTADDLHRLGEILVSIEQDERALNFFYRANQKSANDHFLSEFGLCLLKLNKSAQATPIFEKLVAKRPPHSLALLGMGIAFYQQQNFLAAKNYIDAAVEADPQLQRRLARFGIEFAP